MKRFFSTVRIHAPGLLLSLYVFSFWILPQDWNEDNTLDGSWRYALGMFRGDGFSLGKDSWFTYGPLAHWFGAPMGAEQYHPFPFYVLGFFVAGIIFFLNLNYVISICGRSIVQASAEVIIGIIINLARADVATGPGVCAGP